MPNARVTEVADGVFAYAQHDGGWWVNTTGFVATPDQVLAIDTCATEQRTRALRHTVDATVGAPVRLLVNTHHHGDHTYGNALFPEATIIGHRRCRARMLADTVLAATPPIWEPTPQWGELSIHPPAVTFTDRLTVWLADLAVRLEYVGGPAHTDCDVLAWLPDRGVLFTGDLVVNGGTPMLLDGSITGYLEALDRVAGYPAQVLVPGHGEPCGPGVLDHLREYARFVLDAAQRGHATGMDALDTARHLDLGAFADLLDAERIVLNLHRAYADLTGGEVDRVAAFGDAIMYHGGPLRCVA